jgi:hypothetical protein
LFRYRTETAQQFLKLSFDSIYFQAEKYKNEPPNALDVFKDCHYSKKKGFTPEVQSVIVSKAKILIH